MNISLTESPQNQESETTDESPEEENLSKEEPSSELSMTEPSITDTPMTEPQSTERVPNEVSSTEVSSTESLSTESPLETDSTETEQITETENETVQTEQMTETEVSTETETEIETEMQKTLQAAELEEVYFNTGSKVMRVSNEPVSKDIELKWDELRFDENGAYTIHIPEMNPFFPYEVQFTYNGETNSKWFMTPNDCVEVGGHSFYVAAEFDGKVVTQMSLNVAGTKVVVYPKAKTFKDNVGAESNQLYSLLPLEEKSLTVDLSGFTPAELTMVSAVDVFKGTRELKETDKIIWTYGKSNDDYTINLSGDKLDLSYYTYSPNHVYSSGSGEYYYTSWQMIVGSDDQLDASNIRYLVDVKVTSSQKWLDVTAYKQDSEGKRNNVNVIQLYYYDYSRTGRYLQINVSGNDMGDETQSYISLKVNSQMFSDTKYASMKVYEGRFATVQEAVSGNDITSQILNADMSQTDAGYLVTLYSSQWITMITYDASGNATGCLPFYLNLNKGSNYISRTYLFQRNENGRSYVQESSSSQYIDGVQMCTAVLYKGYSAEAKYCLELTYYKDNKSCNAEVTAAYIGKYNSIAEAKEANAQEVKASLFNDDYRTGGYEADFSKGITFSIFIGEDDTELQEKYVLNYKTIEGTKELNSNSGTAVTFTGLMGKDKEIGSYATQYNEDSYAEYNYLTMIVGADVDLTNVAPEFYTASGVKLYAPGSSSPEVSGKSFHDFSQGPVHYTTASEDGSNQRNYWLQIVKAESKAGKLYVNSLADPESNTKTENGVVYSKREAIIDSYHNNIHDILLINMGTDGLKELSVELSSDVLELDEYWTLKGKFELSGFTTTEKKETYGELSNMAKIRLRVKEDAEQKAVISGTLTIKSGSTTLMVLELTGTIGNPHITTTEIPTAVKYVPYGVMIQNNNKYSWNHVTYSVSSGNLPDGMIVKPNGELYGVPKEDGTFNFEVKMSNSDRQFSDDRKTFTLEVTKNTNANVDAATDVGYDVTQRIPNISRNNTSDQLFVSQGVFDEFVDVYLDGIKLTKGVDYDAESGSTRITIKAETLDQDLGKGTHTLGVEFRTKDNDELKRAAQNFNVKDGKENNSNNKNDSEAKSNSGENNNSNISNNSSQPSIPNANVNEADIDAVVPNSDATNSILNPAENADVINYMIEPGDSLWKIAEKFYGNGNYWRKIYEDNIDVINNPDRIFAGQIILIYMTQDVSNIVITDLAADSTTQLPQTDSTDANNTGMNTYVVQSGDNLWKIARQLYGKGWQWRKIYDANTNNLSNPGQLHIGQVLVIPNN